MRFLLFLCLFIVVVVVALVTVVVVALSVEFLHLKSVYFNRGKYSTEHKNM